MAFPIPTTASNDNYNGGSGGALTNLTVGGIVAGDLLFSWGVGDFSGATVVPAQPATGGWSTLSSTNGAIYYKIATATEVAASNLGPDFGVFGAGYNSAAQGVMKVTGADPVTPIQTSNFGTGSGTSLSSSGITVTGKECLLLLFDTATRPGGNGSSPSVTGHAVANSNPTWTTQANQVSRRGAFFYSHVGAASANYSLVGSTSGSATATLSVASYSWAFAIVAIQPPNTVTATSLALTSTLNSVTFVRRMVVTALQLTATLGTPIVSAIASKWRNTAKHVSIWLNQDKS